MSSDPMKVVKKFLEENGYPFEMRVAREFQLNGFGIVQSVYFKDPSLDVLREIDVVALWQEIKFDRKFNIIFAVECKHINTPWILFSSLGTRNDKYYSGNEKSDEWRKHLYKQEFFKNFFEITENAGYSVVATTNDNDKQKDNAFRAVQTILSFLKSENLNPRFSSEGYTIIVPIIAIRGKLFRSSLSKTGEVEISGINEAQLFYNDGTLGVVPKIHIVTDDFLTDYIQRLSSDVKRIFIDPYLSISVVNPPLS